MPTNLVTSTRSRAVTSDDPGAAYLYDGTYVFVDDDGSAAHLYSVASPGSGSPSATSVQTFTLTSATGYAAGLHVVNGVSSSDVWVVIGGISSTSAMAVRHATYNGTWTWDTLTVCSGANIPANTRNRVSIVWTGTYLIAGGRAADNSGTPVNGFWYNYTSTKNGTSGWQTNSINLASSGSTSSTHFFGTFLHDATLGATIAVYSIAGDSVQSRVLPDASSPALANWGAETAVGSGTLTLNQNGVAACWDPSNQTVFAAWLDNAGTGGTPGFVASSSITVSGTSSKVNWGTVVKVNTSDSGGQGPNLATSGDDTLYIFWDNGTNSGNSDIKYVSVSSPYGSGQVGTTTNLTGAAANRNVFPRTVEQDRSTGGYIPLLYQKGTASPWNIVYDNSITAAGGTTAVSVSDSATGTDSYASTILTLPTDSGSGLDGSVYDSATGLDGCLADLGAGTDSVAIGVLVTDSALGTDGSLADPATATDGVLADRATATESVAIGVALTDTGSGLDQSLSEAGAGAEQTSILATFSASLESGAGSDSVALLIQPALADSANATENVTFSTIAFSVTDSAAGADGQVGSTTFAASDPASGSDQISADLTTFTLTDSASGNDGVSVSQGGGSTQIGVSDSASGTDTVSILATFSAALEAGAGADGVAILATLPLADPSSAADTLASLAAALPLADPATGSEASPSFATVVFGVAESGAGAEASAGSTTFATSDAASATDALSGLLIVPLLLDAATGSDLMASLLASTTVPNTGNGLDSIGGWTTIAVGLTDPASATEAVRVASVVLSSPTGTVLLLPSPAGVVVLVAGPSGSVQFSPAPSSTVQFAPAPSGSTALAAAPSATKVELK